MLELFTFLLSKGMKWGSLFHIKVGELGRLEFFSHGGTKARREKKV